MSKCIKCGIEEAVVPDRENPSKRKKLCVKCHSLRLKEDLRLILLLETLKRRGRLS